MTGQVDREADAWDAAAPQPEGVAFIDGAFRPLAEAHISVLDFGFIRGDCTFDTVKVWDGRFFRLDMHVDRFIESCRRLRMQFPLSRDKLIAILMGCVRRSGLRYALVKSVCTRGVPSLGSRDPRDANLNFFAYALPYSDTIKSEALARGLNIALTKVRRISPESVDPTIKNYNRLDFVGGLFEAYDRGADTVLLPDEHGNVTEGPGFNIFAIKGGEATTPDRGVLEGITRALSLKLCEELQIRTHIRPLRPNALRRADEVFATSTAGGIMPITHIDGEAIGDGAVGPLTRRIRDLYWSKHTDPDWTTTIKYD